VSSRRVMARPTSSRNETAVRRPKDEPQTWARDRSITADDNFGIASTGDNTTNRQVVEQVTVLPAEAFAPVSEVAAPRGLMNLPARPHLFVGRGQALANVGAALTGGSGVVAQVVHGLGGIGKSTLAAQYAAAHCGDYSLVWWVAADTRATVDAGLAALA